MSIEFRIQKKGLPFYIQLRDQVRHAICTGRLQPLDKLPSVRALSEQYGISKNTALRAYQELEQEGWVGSDPGSGFIVRTLSERGPGTPDMMPDAVRQFHEALDRAYTAGIAREDFQDMAAKLISQRWTPERIDSEYAVMISENYVKGPTVAEEIGTAIGLPTRWVWLQDVRKYGIWALGDIRRLKVAMSAFYRYAEVRSILSSLPVLVWPITVATHPSVIQEAAGYNRPDVRVAVIAHDAGFIESMSFSASQFLFDAQVVGYASLDEPEAVQNLIARADVVAATFWAECEEHSHLTQGKPVLVFGTAVEPSSVEVLRQMIGSNGQGNQP